MERGNVASRRSVQPTSLRYRTDILRSRGPSGRNATQEIDMKARIIALIVASAFSAAVSAQDNVIEALSQETGLSARDVKMVLGARSGFAEYQASYDQTKKRFVRALGKPRYEEIGRASCREGAWSMGRGETG